MSNQTEWKKVYYKVYDVLMKGAYDSGNNRIVVAGMLKLFNDDNLSAEIERMDVILKFLSLNAVDRDKVIDAVYDDRTLYEEDSDKNDTFFCDDCGKLCSAEDLVVFKNVKVCSDCYQERLEEAYTRRQ